MAPRCADTAPAFRLTRLAYVTAVQNQQMMQMRKKFRRGARKQCLFHRLRRCTGCKPATVAEAEYVRVHRHCVRTESGIQDDVCGLSSHAGKSFQGFPIGRHFSAMAFDQKAREFDHIPRLGAPEAECRSEEHTSEL